MNNLREVIRLTQDAERIEKARKDAIQKLYSKMENEIKKLKRELEIKTSENQQMKSKIQELDNRIKSLQGS